jgi:hypothetical protein
MVLHNFLFLMISFSFLSVLILQLLLQTSIHLSSDSMSKIQRNESKGKRRQKSFDLELFVDVSKRSPQYLCTLFKSDLLSTQQKCIQSQHLSYHEIKLSFVSASKLRNIFASKKLVLFCLFCRLRKAWALAFGLKSWGSAL